MQLRQYLTETNETVSGFARKIGEEQATVSRYVNGHRLPNPKSMIKIVQATKGKVTPNDFYPIAKGARAS